MIQDLNTNIININTNLNTIEDLSLIGDCVEIVYSQLEDKKGLFPLEKIKKIVDSKTKPSDFDVLKNIAKGGYGEVFLAKKDKIYAMKRVPKDVVLKQPHTALFMAEKEVLIDSIGSEWLVSAEMTLQDGQYLYYLMDFIPGGDFMGLLSKEDVLEEEWVRFYVIEIVAALDELHSLGWIHRDLKPDNILIGLDGHIRLADFGSCIKMKEGKARSSITVGTPDYVSPDILTSKSEENEYTENLDFWTLGVIIYEMVYGTTPFYSSTLVETYRKINDLDFIFPFKIGENLKNLIEKLICKKEERLDIQGIKKHPFFEGVDWKNVKKMVPPFIPEIQGEYDTSHFVDTNFEVESTRGDKKREFLEFVGFSHDPKMLNLIKNVSSRNDVIKDSTIKDSTIKNGVIENGIIKIDNNQKLVTEKSDLLSQIQLLNKQIKDKQEEYKRLMLCVVDEKEELEEIQEEIREKTNTLKKILMEINDRRVLCENSKDEKSVVGGGMNCIKEIDQSIKEKETNQCIKQESIKFENDTNHNHNTDHNNTNLLIDCLRMVYNHYDDCSYGFNSLNIHLDSIFEFSNTLLGGLEESHKQNCILSAKIHALENENLKMKKVGVDSLKKQVRILTTEIKEYEQKLNQEIHLRKKLEEELKDKHNSTSTYVACNNYEFPCKILKNNNSIPSSLKIVEDQFLLNEVPHSIGNTFLYELKNNELHHQSYKTRSLCLKIIFIKECIKSVSSVGRRNLKTLEEDLKIEESMVKGLETMMNLLDGKQLEEASKQLAGSQKKIAQLKSEIKESRKSTLNEDNEGRGEGKDLVDLVDKDLVDLVDKDLVDCDLPSNLKLYEFNNHLYASKTFPQGVLCEHCNEVLYGIKDQGFECRDCKMVVHKSCYVLGDVSCEMYNAFKTGERNYVIMRSIEDKEKLLSVYKNYY